MDWERGFFGGGWGLSQGVVSWATWEKEVWLFFKVERLGLFFFFQRIISLVMWVVGKRGWVFFFFFP